MIQASDVVALLLEACPSANQAWQKHLDYWEGDERGHYIDISIFVRHIVDSYGKQSLQEFPDFFTLLEMLIEKGDEETKGLAIVGLIEGLQNVASHKPHGYDVFIEHLGPLSQQGWIEIEQLWTGKSSLVDIIRSQKMPSS